MKTKNRLFLMLAILAGLSIGIVACDDDDDNDDDAAADADADGDTDADGDSDSDADAESCVEDAAVVPVVTVDYAGEQVEVTLADVETATLGSVAVVPFSGIIAKAFPAVDLAAVTFDIEACDGFKPSTGKCSSVLPTDGANAEKSGIDTANQYSATWDASLADLAAATCAAVWGVKVIYVADK